jgi:hypothetical protein
VTGDYRLHPMLTSDCWIFLREFELHLERRKRPSNIGVLRDGTYGKASMEL